MLIVHPILDHPRANVVCIVFSGVTFRERYISMKTCNATATCLPPSAVGAADSKAKGENYGLLGTPGVGYGSFDVYVRSSSLDRSTSSALSFFGGIFPATNNATFDAYLPTGQQIVPVYSAAPDVHDVLIRAYTKCPTYEVHLWWGLCMPRLQSAANSPSS